MGKINPLSPSNNARFGLPARRAIGGVKYLLEIDQIKKFDHR